ncbi:neurofascin-like [Ptychodera flava]|uniref:neurofascin-like n=1 Tax=Ptychodera flava TaxID=63121 RepID=UPI00396A30D6
MHWSDPMPPANLSIHISEDPVVEYSTATLTCSSSGNPDPTYGWLQNVEPLPGNERYELSDNNSKLTITPVLREDMMEYSCVATNDFGSDEANIYVNVLYLPDNGWPECMVTYYTSENEPKAGDRAEITCTATDGNPYPSLVWYNGSNVLDGTYTTPEGEDDKITSNVFEWSLTAYDNGKKYQCEGDHPALSTPRACDTGVLDIKFAPLSALLTGYTDTARKGDRVELSCVTDSSNPVSIISWYKNYKLITDDDYEEIQEEDIRDGGFHGKVTEGGLHFDVLASHNENEFSCKTTRIEYSEEDLTVSVTTFVYYAPLVKNNEENQQQTVNLTDTADLLCEINSNPEVEITWFDNDNKTISNLTDKFLARKITSDTITTGVLTIFNVSESDLGYYRCHASNEINGVNFIINLWGKRKEESQGGAYADIHQTDTEYMGLVFRNRNPGM